MIKKAIAILIFGIVVLSTIGTAAENGYYAYGDSITVWPDCYILQMVASHDPVVPVLRNFDGSGKGSAWALENLAAHYDPAYSLFVIEFGVNDHNNDITAQNLIQIYNIVSASGSIPIVLIPTLRLPNGDPEYDYTNQSARIQVLQDTLDAAGVSYVKMYDAIDTVPGNGLLDQFDQQYYIDHVHPNYGGHTRMGEYLWGYLHPGLNNWALDYNGNGVWDISDIATKFGKDRDNPVVGDWDGNGITDIGVFRSSTGYWYLDTNKDGVSDFTFHFGKVGDWPVVGDWDGNGITDIGVFRSSSGMWYFDTTKTGTVSQTLAFGKAGDTPVVGDWNDNGNEKAGVYRSPWQPGEP